MRQLWMILEGTGSIALDSSSAQTAHWIISANDECCLAQGKRKRQYTNTTTTTPNLSFVFACAFVFHCGRFDKKTRAFVSQWEKVPSDVEETWLALGGSQYF